MLLLTVTLWALNFTAAKFILTHGFRPLAFASVRYGLAGLLFTTIVLPRERSLRVGRTDLGLVCGGVVERATPVHGKASQVFHEGRGILAGVSNPFDAGRYHSLVVDEVTLPEELEVSARTEDGLIMGLEHRTLPRTGVQFHPESILTPEGPRLVANFLAQADVVRRAG